MEKHTRWRSNAKSSDILWMCSRCYACAALCPQNVKFNDVMSVLREMAVREGYVPVERLEKARELDRAVQSIRCRMIISKLHPEEESAEEIVKSVEDELREGW